MKESIFIKENYKSAPGGNLYKWNEAETKFIIPKNGKYVISITASAQSGKQNETEDDDDLRVSINGYEFGKPETHEEKISWHGFGTSAAWNGASLKGANKTVYFFIELNTETEKMFNFHKNQEQIIQFFADGKPKIRKVEVFEIEGDYFEIVPKELHPIKTDTKGIPYASIIFLGMRPKNVRIYTNCKSSTQKGISDGDNVKVVLNGKIIPNNKAPTSDKYKNFYFSGDLNKGETQCLDLNEVDLQGYESAIEFWYDETPILGTMEISFYPVDDLGNYIVNSALTPFQLPLKLYFQEITNFILSDEFSIIQSKSNTNGIDELWKKAMKIEGYDIIKATNLLVYGIYYGSGKIPHETDKERDERVKSIPNSIYDRDKNDNRDKLQHFFGSANLVLRYGKSFTLSTGQIKELIDKWIKKSKYDPGDIKANIKGVEFGLLLKSMPDKNIFPSNVLKDE